MTAKTTKTLGELRQWHLQRAEEAQALANTWKHDKSYVRDQGKLIRKHNRFAKAIEQCLPLELALRGLYNETADYIRVNKLGDVHHNQTMKAARDALKRK
jgi:hypothetical protein